MADEVTVAEKKYISSKRAAETSGYAQDYIGQLARSGQIEAQRIGGLWFISMESLMSYKAKAEECKPQPPQIRAQGDIDSIVTLDGKDYVSAIRAAEITGYNQDYVGQLARTGKVLSRQIGSRWYVEREGVLQHKREKDALLAAVQTASVGLARSTSAVHGDTESLANATHNGDGPFLRYTSDSGDLMPVLPEVEVPVGSKGEPIRTTDYVAHKIPIRVRHIANSRSSANVDRGGEERARSLLLPVIIPVASLATIVIVITVGYTWIGDKAVYAKGNLLSNTAAASMAGQLTGAVASVSEFLERAIVPELIYIKKNDDFKL